MTTPTVTWQSDPPEKLLKERFHISTGFHPGQRDIIEQLVQGKRLLANPAHGLGEITLLSNGKPLLSISHSGLLTIKSPDARPVPAL